MPEQGREKKVSVQEVCATLCEYCAKGNKPERISGYSGYTHRWALNWEDKAYCKATPILIRFAD